VERIVKYMYRVITTPLLLLDLLLTAALPWPTVMYTILIDEVMIITGLVGALVVSSYKWGYFTFGCVALAWIVYVLVWEARKHANAMGRDVGKAFLYCGSLTAFLWILYPIAWGLCEGGNVISPDSEVREPSPKAHHTSRQSTDVSGVLTGGILRK